MNHGNMNMDIHKDGGNAYYLRSPAPTCTVINARIKTAANIFEVNVT